MAGNLGTPYRDRHKAQLERFSKRFWSITRFILDKRANFAESALAFDLEQPPREAISHGRYHFISKSAPALAKQKVRNVTHSSEGKPKRGPSWVNRRVHVRPRMVRPRHNSSNSLSHQVATHNQWARRCASSSKDSEERATSRQRCPKNLFSKVFCSD